MVLQGYVRQDIVEKSFEKMMRKVRYMRLPKMREYDVMDMLENEKKALLKIR